MFLKNTKFSQSNLTLWDTDRQNPLAAGPRIPEQCVLIHLFLAFASCQMQQALWDTGSSDTGSSTKLIRVENQLEEKITFLRSVNIPGKRNLNWILLCSLINYAHEWAKILVNKNLSSGKIIEIRVVLNLPNNSSVADRFSHTPKMHLLELCCLTCDTDLETSLGPWTEFCCLTKTNRAVTWSNGAVPPEEVKPPSPEAEMLNDVENLHGFLDVANFRLLSDDEVDVNVGVDEVPVGAAAHGALDAHEAVLLHTHRAVTCHSCCCSSWAQGTAKAAPRTSHSYRQKRLKHELEQKSWSHQRSPLRTKESST